MCIKGNLRQRRNKKYYQATHLVTTNLIRTHYLPLKPVLALVFSTTDAPSLLPCPPQSWYWPWLDSHTGLPPIPSDHHKSVHISNQVN